jgi:hypothetical protein
MTHKLLQLLNITTIFLVRAISFKIYKQTDSGMALLTKRDNGVIQAGNSYSVNVLKTADFYNIKELKSGTYKLQYLVSDTTAGEKYFKLL